MLLYDSGTRYTSSVNEHALRSELEPAECTVMFRLGSLLVIIVMVDIVIMDKHTNTFTYTSPTLQKINILGSLFGNLFLLTLPSLAAPAKFHLY